MTANAALARQLTVDVWSDIACPFCWIGEHRLGAALAALAAEWPEVAVRRRWRPFQLQPDLPRPGADWGPFARAKFGGEAGMAEAFGHVARMGAEDGLEYRFDRIAAAPNTADAHRLVLDVEALHPGDGGVAAAADDGGAVRRLLPRRAPRGRARGAGRRGRRVRDWIEPRCSTCSPATRTRPRWRTASARRRGSASAACRSW
jgi:hypothetical protein